MTPKFLPPSSRLISALILAGGQSSRMGSDKAFVCWQGVPLLRRVCDVAQHCCASVSVLSPWPHKYEAILPKQIQMVHETEPGQGPLVGLYHGLGATQSTWVLLLACDMPCLDPRVLQRWITQLEAPESEEFARVPYHHERWEPFCGMYHQAARASLKQYIDQGGRSFQRWLAQASVKAIALDTALSPMFWNCNTPTDLRREV